MGRWLQQQQQQKQTSTDIKHQTAEEHQTNQFKAPNEFDLIDTSFAAIRSPVRMLVCVVVCHSGFATTSRDTGRSTARQTAQMNCRDWDDGFTKNAGQWHKMAGQTINYIVK